MREQIEIKIQLSPEAAKKLLKTKNLKTKTVKPSPKGGRKRRRLVSTYFDTPRHILRRSSIALRIRDDGQHRVQTIKTPGESAAGLHSRRAWTVAIDGERPVLAPIRDDRVSSTLSRRRFAERLRSVFTTDFDRTTLRLQVRDAEVEMAIDQGVIVADRNGTRREEAICEAEFELLSGDPAVLIDLVLEVCEAFGLRLGHLTKTERGYALARPALRPRPLKAGRVRLSADHTAGQAFQRIATAALEHLFQNEAPTLRGHPEGVHQTRVAMRRLRAALRAFKDMLPYDKRKAFNGELRWFQQRLAPARDWHVFLAETVPVIEADEPRADLARLRRLALEERRRATLEAVSVLESRRYTRLVLRFQRWLAELENDIPTKTYDQNVAPFTRGVLQKTWRELLRETRSLRRLPGEDLHELRKRGKKARYATEFFRTLWTNDEPRTHLKLMSRLQDGLGAANDAAVARQILWTVRPSRLDPAFVRIVQSWSQRRIDECIRAAQPDWRRLQETKPFWEA